MEDTLKKIVSEASRLCREQGIAANAHTIAYTACIQDVSKALDSVAPGTSVLNQLEPAVVAGVAAQVTKQLKDKDHPLLAAARMQVMMEVVFMQQRELLNSEAAEKEERIGMLSRAVTEGRVPEGVAGHERMAARVLEYVSVVGGMEIALTDDVAKEEVRVAMESVFPLSTLVRFTTLSSPERQQQVESLARMTTGICLYNQTLGRGGTALPPGVASYLPQAQRLLRDIERHVAALSADVAAYAALVRLNTPAQGAQENAESKATRERAQAESVHKAQALILWEGLRDDLAAGLQAVSALDGELQHWLLQVHDTVGSSRAVPKETVLPAFERLGTIHQALGEELRMLVVRQRLADELVTLMDGYVTLLQRMAKTRRPGKKTSVEAELATMQAEMKEWQIQEPAQLQDGCVWVPGREAATANGPDANGFEVVEVSAVASASDAPVAGPILLPPGLALNGFDPVVLGSQAYLVRADPQLGFITHNQVTYGFSSPSSMASFAAAPVQAVAAAHSAITAQPVLARLLGRSAAFPALDLAHIVKAMSGPLKVDFGCQTPTHFVDRNIDHSYEWNEWALRRRALALANLRQKRTHGTQTGLSHFKRDAESQIWQPKAAVVQTRVNKGQTMPRKLQYVTGLRGAPATKMHVVRLELELGQPHQY